MGFFSERDIEIQELIYNGADRELISALYPDMERDELDMYFGDDMDYDILDANVISYDDLVNEPEWVDEEG